MRERLTAPFDCSHYSLFCEQVGPDAAYDITGEMVDLALDGAAPADIEAHLDLRIEAAVALADEAEALAEETFRSSGNWATKTWGDYRLKVRNGITTPLFGKRRGWTEAKVLHYIFFWDAWLPYNTTQLCVNTGLNSQWRFDYNTNDNLTLLEALDPANHCINLNNNLTRSTYHARNNSPGASHYFIIEVHGCASGSINGSNWKLCATPFTEKYY